MFGEHYFWIVIVGAIGAFGFGWATGANDVANAFGTSVGAKTLTMAQATLIAAVFEFTGAMVLGRVVTNTIAGGIADVTVFKNDPLVYAYGMMWTVIVGGLWQGIASYCEWNVSATHSIIGGIMGFAFAAKGPQGVLWVSYDPTSFPPYKGIVPIVLSWFIAPVLTASASALIFSSIRSTVLRYPPREAQRRSLLVFPALVLLTSFINVYFVLTKGAKKFLVERHPGWTDDTGLWVAAVTAVSLAVLSYLLLPFIKKHIEHVAVRDAARAEETDALRRRRQQEEEEEVKGRGGEEIEVITLSMQETEVTTTRATTAGATNKNHSKESVYDSGHAISRSSSNNNDHNNHSNHSLERAKAAGQFIRKVALHGVSVDIHEIVQTDELVAMIHHHAETFPEEAEQVFAYLQVFSAICVILAHGAGEVGYMAGPLGTIWDIHQTGTMHKKLTPPAWIVLYSALSLVIGLATYGYNVTRAMGTRMCKLTPSRGFAAELSTALVILVSSQWGLPNSSSQCITGGIVGVGMLEGGKGVNWAFFGKTFGSWVATIVLMAVGTGMLFAQGVYAPCTRL